MRTAGSTCGAGSMQLSRVRPSVRLSVPLGRRCWGFAAVGPAAGHEISIDTAARAACRRSRDGAQQQTQSGDVGSWTSETCYVALTS